MGMHPILSSSNPSGKVGTELKLDCDMTARDRHRKTWADVSKHGKWGRRKSGTVGSTESCTPAHLFLTTFAKDLAGDSRSPLQQFVLLRRKKKISTTKVTLVKTDKTQIQLKSKGWCDSRHMKNKTWPFNTVVNFLVKKVYFTSSELKMFIPHFLIKWMVRKTILYIKPKSNQFTVGIHQSEKQSESNR